MSNLTPTTQAAEQLRADIIEKLDEWSLLPGTTHEEDCDFWGCDDGQGKEFCNCEYRREVDAWDKCLPEIISALADTLKVVGEEIIGNEVTVNPHLGTVNPQEAQNRLRVAQRQRLELVVGEMRAR